MFVLYKHGEYHSHSKNHGPRPPPRLGNLQRRKVLHMFSKVRLREYPVVGTQSLGDAAGPASPCLLWVVQSCGTLVCWSMQHPLQGSVPGSPGEAAELQGCHTTTGLLKCSYCLAAPGIRHIHDMSVMLKLALLKPLFFGNLHVCASCLSHGEFLPNSTTGFGCPFHLFLPSFPNTHFTHVMHSGCNCYRQYAHRQNVNSKNVSDNGGWQQESKWQQQRKGEGFSQLGFPVLEVNSRNVTETNWKKKLSTCALFCAFS